MDDAAFEKARPFFLPPIALIVVLVPPGDLLPEVVNNIVQQNDASSKFGIQILLVFSRFFFCKKFIKFIITFLGIQLYWEFVKKTNFFFHLRIWFSVIPKLHIVQADITIMDQIPFIFQMINMNLLFFFSISFQKK